MKKLALTLAGVAAIATFAPEASAIPAFARQVGMACSACHYQHFPVLNAFGRSFKQGGYTMAGSQEKIEGDGISLPGTLNAAVIGYVQYQKTNGAPSTTTTTGTNDGQLQIPQQVSLFMGGRAGEHMGFEAEVNLNGNTQTGQAGGVSAGGTGAGTGLIRFKAPIVADTGDNKTEVIPFSTANGAADSFEILNTGAVNVHTFNQSGQGVVSAAQYIGTGTAANGFALVTSNEHYFVNIAKFGSNAGDGVQGGNNSNYVRAAWTTDAISGFDSAIGFQSWSGSSSSTTYALNTASIDTTSGTNQTYAVTNTATTTLTNTQAYAIDAQMMGDVAGMPLLIVASYASAPSTSSTGVNNLYNGNALTKSSFNIGAELGIVSNVATVQVAYRKGNNGVDDGTGSSQTDNVYLLGATYALALNARVELTYLSGSGTAYSQNPTNATQSVIADLAFGF